LPRPKNYLGVRCFGINSIYFKEGVNALRLGKKLYDVMIAKSFGCAVFCETSSVIDAKCGTTEIPANYPPYPSTKRREE
jgi:hypothetical protein